MFEKIYKAKKFYIYPILSYKITLVCFYLVNLHRWLRVCENPIHLIKSSLVFVLVEGNFLVALSFLYNTPPLSFVLHLDNKKNGHKKTKNKNRKNYYLYLEISWVNIAKPTHVFCKIMSIFHKENRQNFQHVCLLFEKCHFRG